MDTVQVWLIRTPLPEVTVAALAALLDAEEQQRAAALVAPGRRHRFVAAHGAARVILGEELGIPPEQLEWERGPHGKPELAGQPVRVNLSHSGELATLAVTGHRKVGVDIQELRDLDACRLAARFFPAAEARFVAAAPDLATQLARFTRLWTRKEACVKSAGARLVQGLGLPVRGYGGLVAGLDADPAGHCRVPAEPCRVRDLPVPDGFRAAVALTGPEPFRAIRRWWRP